MKTSTFAKYGIAAIVFLAIAFQWTKSYTYKGGAFAGWANDPTSKNTCFQSGCHGTKNIPTTKMTFSGAPAAGYVGGTKYTLTLNFTKTGCKAYGFELIPMDSINNKMCGTIASGSGSKTVSSGTKTYLTHNAVATSGSWKFTWTAPTAGTSTVNFYVVVNAADNNGNTSPGDSIYNQIIQIREANPKPVASFNFSPSSPCEDDSVTFTDASTNNPTSWAWTFTNGSPATSTLQNPKVAFKAGTADTAKLIATNSGGSSTVYYQVLSVNALPSDAITVGGTPATTGTACSGDSLLITAPTGASWLWSNGSAKQSIYVKNAGKYSVVTTNSAGCIKQSKVFTLSLGTKPTTPTLSGSVTSICPGESVTFTAATGYTSYIFYDGTKSVQSSASNTYTTSGLASGNSITVVGINSSGCKSDPSSSVSVTVNTAPGKPVISSPAYCIGDSATLNVTPDPNVTKYTFYHNGTKISSGTTSSYRFVPSSATNKDSFYVEVENSGGCKSQSSKIVLKATKMPVAAFTFAPKITNNSYDFTDKSVGAFTHKWEFGDASNGKDTGKTVNYKYKNQGLYRVLLTVSIAPGCTDTISHLLNAIYAGIAQTLPVGVQAEVFPNPVHDVANLKVSVLRSQEMDIQIYNQQNILVSSRKQKFVAGMNNLVLPLTNLAPGTYFLLLKGKEESKTIKIIKD